MPKACSRCPPAPAGNDGISMTFYSLLGQRVDHLSDLMQVKRNRGH